MASPPVVFVHEFISGGGWPQEEIPQGLAGEGMAMLAAVLADFRAWGGARTITTCDDRVEELFPVKLPADEVVQIPAAYHKTAFRSILERCDAVLLIAPETDGALAGLTEIAETAGVPLLGCSSESVRITGDKAVCGRFLQKADIPIPPTRMTRFLNAREVAAGSGYPLVIKPIDGVGCEGVCLVNQPSDLPDALRLIWNTTFHDQILLQSYIPGVHASASLLVAHNRALPISLNRQIIEEGCPFHYLGGSIPLEHPAGKAALDMACSAALAVPGLRGYVGVDLILTEDRAWVIEINPRLTTSYVGLRRVIWQNLAQMIWDACRYDILPEQIALSGKADFFMQDLRNPSMDCEDSKAHNTEAR